ncbi:MAG: nucleotidyltransferase family protein [bacterium]|nr:nucleotidyltransferase family protein [bacterium]
MKIRDRVESRRDEILAIAKIHGATRISLSGSGARGEDDSESDVDFLVELEPRRSMLDLGALQMDLQDLLGRPVDVVTPAGLRAHLRAKVLHEATPL